MFNRSNKDNKSNKEGISLGRVVEREGKEKEVRYIKLDRY